MSWNRVANISKILNRYSIIIIKQKITDMKLMIFNAQKKSCLKELPSVQKKKIFSQDLNIGYDF